MNDHRHDTPAPDITVDGTGLPCVRLLLRQRKEIDGAEPGMVVHVIATDPAAPLDLPAWCRMTGHHYLGPVPGRAPDRYVLRLAARPTPTRPGAPWHRAESPQGRAPAAPVTRTSQGAPDGVCAISPLAPSDPRRRAQSNVSAFRH
ncbi:sulfurtransferase TusA family protein [Streptomyces sp. NPDC015661]|uniref:sulfurtransferase TusA family protein n=1 Tax=Streptomyces sp. NPDC015661 TaxID=3364961 RepID=UPI0037006AA6